MAEPRDPATARAAPRPPSPGMSGQRSSGLQQPDEIADLASLYPAEQWLQPGRCGAAGRGARRCGEGGDVPVLPSGLPAQRSPRLPPSPRPSRSTVPVHLARLTEETRCPICFGARAGPAPLTRAAREALQHAASTPAARARSRALARARPQQPGPCLAPTRRPPPAPPGKIKSARVSIACLHRFCAACIDQFMRSPLDGGKRARDQGKECPVCRAHLSSRRAVRPVRSGAPGEGTWGARPGAVCARQASRLLNDLRRRRCFWWWRIDTCTRLYIHQTRTPCLTRSSPDCLATSRPTNKRWAVCMAAPGCMAACD